MDESHLIKSFRANRPVNFEKKNNKSSNKNVFQQYSKSKKKIVLTNNSQSKKTLWLIIRAECKLICWERVLNRGVCRPTNVGRPNEDTCKLEFFERSWQTWLILKERVLNRGVRRPTNVGWPMRTRSQHINLHSALIDICPTTKILLRHPTTPILLASRMAYPHPTGGVGWE